MNLKRRKSSAIIFARFPYDSQWGGEESHTLTLAQYFRNRGYEVIFMGNCPTLLPRFRSEGFKVCEVEGGKMIVTPFELIKSFFLSFLWKINMRKVFLDLMSEYEVKALYSLSLNEKLFLTQFAFKHGIPVTWVEHQEIRNWLLRSPWKALYKKNAKQVKIVPISKNNKFVLENDLSVPEKNIVEIIHGVDLEDFAKISRDHQKGLILAANRLIPKKGMLDFLAAVKILLQEGLKVEVKMVGEGEEKEKIEGQIRESRLQFLNKIELFPPLKKDEWYKLLSQTDVYVSCARDSNETFSLNTAEALAAGCKVVVTKCSGIADYLEDGKEAFLTEPNHPENLAEKIKLALVAPEKIRKQAIEAAQTKFDLKRMLSEYEAVILRNI